MSFTFIISRFNTRKMSSDDEDYMSNDFLNKMADVKPGVSSCRNTQRMLRINARNDAAKEQQIREKPATKMEMERNRLEEGINRPIESGNKGFKLLAMMGYKPGMSLGKAREGQMGGIKEPIQIELKAGRTGIGHEEEQKGKQKERCEAHMEMMRKRARMEEVLADDFRSRKRFLTIQKQLIGDIQKSRRACQEMDIRLGKESPEEFWFWPIYSSKRQMDDDAVDEEEIAETKKKKSKLELIVNREENEKEEIGQFMYSNGRPVQMDVNFWEMDEKQLECNLAQILNYMRTIHFYCIFCGCAFEDAEDLFANCPGPTRNQHDEE